ncbi:hypothetical protein [Curtobacterium ammoniigenes]|uniref:hypothetical protein n=1 Tax=Curtobacterium ammoniigenes TaxID=395387 RepID=UPI000A4B0955|nr:hypothetical protein [Curtobacterium ammoniigenes]
MANAMGSMRDGVDRVHAVQFLPAPVTLLALAVGGTHHLGVAPLGVIAIIGALATIGSVLLPMLRPASASSALPIPREEDRIR